MNPNNGLVGDASSVDLPQSTPDVNDLVEEKKMAKYSKTAEFKRIQEHFAERTKFYQQYMPDGRPVAAVPKKDLDGMWIAANVIIAEFSQVINMYENAREVVDAENKQNELPPS